MNQAHRSLRFPDIYVAVERLELKLRPAAVDRAVHGVIDAHAVFAAVGPAIFDHRLAPEASSFTSKSL